MAHAALPTGRCVLHTAVLSEAHWHQAAGIPRATVTGQSRCSPRGHAAKVFFFYTSHLLNHKGRLNGG